MSSTVRRFSFDHGAAGMGVRVMSEDGQPTENIDAMLVGQEELSDAIATVASGMPVGGRY